MNKKQMVAKLAKATNITQAKAYEVINALFDPSPKDGLIAAELAQQQKVTIPGFGTFGARVRAARTALRPGTTEKVSVAAKTYPYFRAGKTLKEEIVGG
jgi:DNA-binding protein HU-beta